MRRFAVREARFAVRGSRGAVRGSRGAVRGSRGAVRRQQINNRARPLPPQINNRARPSHRKSTTEPAPPSARPPVHRSAISSIMSDCIHLSRQNYDEETFSLRSTLRNRLPDRRQFIPVLSTIVFIVFTWTIYHALYQVPGWLYYLTLPGILALMAYILGFALFESLLVAALLLAYCFLLPSRWFKENFAAQGFLLSILLTMTAYLLRTGFEKIQKLENWQLAAIPLAIILGIALLAPLLASLLNRIPKLKEWLDIISNRLTVFSYIYIPLGIVGWLVVFVRNLI
jgi:hypothetical protein